MISYTKTDEEWGQVNGKGIEAEMDAQNTVSAEESFRDLLPNATDQSVRKFATY